MRIVLLLLMLVSLAGAQDSLRILLNNNGVEYGTAYGNITRIATQSYANTFAINNFDWFTVTSDFSTICPTTEGVYDFTVLDSLVHFGYRNGKKIHMNCVFFGQTSRVPAWLQSSGKTATQIRSTLNAYVDTLFKRYTGRILTYEIVNELMGNSSSAYDATTWLEVNAGPHWWRYVIDYANTVKGNAKIGYNDNTQLATNYGGGRNAWTNLLKIFRADSLTLDFIGFQSHLSADTNGYYRFSTFKELCDETRKIYNVPIYITELDIKLPKIVADSSINMQRQAKMYASFFKTALKCGIKRVSVWVWNDADSWIDATYPGFGYATMYFGWNGSSYVPKRAWRSTIDMLKKYNDTIYNVDGDIKIRINNTAVADSQSVFCHNINLHNIPSRARFFNTINSNRSNLLVTDSGGTVIKSFVSGLDKTRLHGILNVNTAVYPDKPVYIVLKISDTITTGVNDTTLFNDAGIVFDMDFSKTTPISDKIGNVLDSVVGPSGIISDTSSVVGYYYRVHGTSYAINKTSIAPLAINSGTISSVFAMDTIDATRSRYLYALGNLAGTYSTALRTYTDGRASNLIRVNGTSTGYFPVGDIIDTLYNYQMFTWGSNQVFDYFNDKNVKTAKTYTNAYTTTEGRINLFCDWARTANSNAVGRLSYLRIYNTVKTNGYRSTESNMAIDNASFYEFPELYITQQPVSDTVTAGQSATFFVTATGSPTYQWYRNDSLISGATNDTFTYTSRLLSSINSKPYRDKIYCLLTTDTTISTNTVYLTGNPPQLNGSKAWQTITINSSAVSETNAHFLYQRKIPRIGAVLANVDSSNDVAVTRINDTARIPRWVVFTTDTIYLYADIAVNATTDTSYRLQFGKALSEVNASAAFSNCGITNFWGFDEASGTTTTDYVGSANGTVVGAATIGNNGLFRNSYSTASGGSINCGQTPITAGATNLSFTSVVNIVDNTSQMFFERTRDANNVVRFRVNSNLVAEVRNGSTAQYTSTAAFTAVGQWAHIGFSYNAGTMKLYVNGVPFAGSGSGNATLPSLTGFNFNFSGASFPIKGSQDNAALYSITLSDGYYLDRHTMLFTPSTFSTLGDVQVALLSTTGSRKGLRFTPGIKVGD